jgi:hypothetical protein
MSNKRAGSVHVRVLAESPAAFSAEHADEAGHSIDKVAGRIAPTADGSVRMLAFSAPHCSTAMA